MDDLPSQAANGSSEREGPATPGDTSRSANVSEPRGIYDLAERFLPLYLAIARGVQAAKPRGADADEWNDVLQETAIDAYALCESKPGYFTDIPVQLWAKGAANYRLMKQKRKERRRVARDTAYGQEALPPSYDPYLMSDLLDEEDEKNRAIVRFWKLLKPRSRAVLGAVYVRELTYAQAAAELGLSERTVKREVEKTRARARLELKADTRRGR